MPSHSPSTKELKSLNCVRTLNIILLKLIVSIFFITIIFSCSQDKEQANNKLTMECARLLLLTQNSNNSGLSQEELSLQNNSNVKLAYSCSSIEGMSPSCRELYSLDAESVYLTELCPSGFHKFQALCSRQNNIGHCSIFSLSKSRWERRIYARPNDDVMSAQKDCYLARGNFQDQSELNLNFSIVASCILKENLSN